MSNNILLGHIERLKKERDAVILAHYYVSDEVQMAADFIGDSYYLSKIANTVPQKVICMAGVKFMGESAKVLNPDKLVLIPEPDADCPMAHMADINRIEEVKNKYDDLAVVCYINSTAELKAHADVCVTSANAEKIVSNLSNKNIYFIPDENLGRYIATKLPDKNFIFNDGFCHVHADITIDDIKKVKSKHPGVHMLAHPECRSDVLEYSDYIGSTSGIIKYVSQSSDNEFIICTELGVMYELKNKNPHKRFYPVNSKQYCPDMKKITLQKIELCLSNMQPVVKLSEHQIAEAYKPLLRMLQMTD